MQSAPLPCCVNIFITPFKDTLLADWIPTMQSKNAIKLQADVSFRERCSNVCSDDTKGLVEALETSVCGQNYSAAGSQHSQMVIVNLRELVVGQLLHKGQMRS